ncbi:NADPH:quinone reductase [Virgisporangium aliadipatigenens]|uniref:NADPH:quinone reductase n=1 Tax=Virgisporangium aliadipatigenens TaxID=741659 RepID=A0A8J4DS67_9ACTN|nr:NAD(P)-dependent alcohol dehydrogenase [Virgisporangium aliadipatigenens]GIJ48895.1 NADPH:quinone reductase [Virgisporangium aliadipatigenens]
MKAYIQRTYGSAERLHLEEIPTPAPTDNEVLVRVRATSVNPYDWHGMRGEPRIARLMPSGLGLRGPSIPVLGCDMAGTVESVGRNVTGFRPGDNVYGLLTGGGFGELVTVPEDLLAPMPKNLTHEEAAAVPMAAVTAFVGLRDAGGIRAGHTVLVNGASGGVGTFAVQLARAFGAAVVGVCGPHNVALVRSLGADRVIDYTQDTSLGNGGSYDIVLDNAGSRPIGALRRTLTRTGTFVMVGGPGGRWFSPADRMVKTVVRGPFVPQRMAVADAVGCTRKKQVLLELNDLIEAGRVTPVIDRRFSFEQLRDAVNYQEEGHSPGKVVVTVS